MEKTKNDKNSEKAEWLKTLKTRLDHRKEDEAERQRTVARVRLEYYEGQKFQEELKELRRVAGYNKLNRLNKPKPTPPPPPLVDAVFKATVESVIEENLEDVKRWSRKLYVFSHGDVEAHC